MAWIYNTDKSTQGKGTNLFKDWVDSTLAGVTNQDPAWKVAADSAKRTNAMNNTSTHSNNQPAADNGDNNSSPTYTPGSNYSAQAAQAARDKQYTIGSIDNEINRINQALGNLDATRGAGLTQLDDEYNKGASRINQQLSSALSKYATKTADTKRDFARSTEDIGINANNKYQALMNLLGRSGSGRSSAADNVVPYAVSQDASKSRGEVADSYALNRRDLRDAEDDTKQSASNNLQDLGDQRRTKQASLTQDIEGKRSDYNNTLASLRGQRTQAAGGSWAQAKNDMQGNINARDQIDRALANLLNNYRNAYTVQDVSVKDPTMKNYATDLNGVDVSDPNGTGYDTDTSSDYLANLKKDEDKKKALAAAA